MADFPLLKAASVGDLKEVRRLLTDGHEIDERGEPLSKAELKKLRWWINEAGVNDAAGAVGRPFDFTPLMAALAEGHFETAAMLLEAGGDPNAIDSLKRTPLMLAIHWKQADLADRLIAAGAEVNLKDAAGDPILTQAIQSQAWEIAEKLIDAGANPNPKAKTESIPLVAVSYYHEPEAISVMKRLLEGGAKPHNSAPLANAVKSGDMEIIGLLVELGSPLQSSNWLDDPLTHAAMNAKYEAARFLIEQGARVTEQPDDDGILCYVASAGASDDETFLLAETLLAAGADATHANQEGYTPLHRAVSCGRAKFARWLLERGANPNRCYDDDQTPLDIAIEEYERAETRLSEIQADQEDDPEQREYWEQKVLLYQDVVSVLEEFGGCRADDSQRSPDDENPVLELAPAERRGLCDAKFFKTHQLMIRADIDEIADVLEKDKKFSRIERDVFHRLDELERPLGDCLVLVKLKGHSWVYVAGGRRPRGDSPMKAWSKKLRAPVLYAGEERVASVVFYALYDGGKCVESFESDGVWFRGGIEIDPEVQEESERMFGTSFQSQIRDEGEIDWTAYESEWNFLDRFLREHDAYLTFLWAGPAVDRTIEISAYHDDEATAEAIERVDLVYYKPTTAQQRAAEAQSQEDPLYEAIKAGNLQAAREAIDAGSELNQLPPRQNQSYLLSALGCAMFHRSQAIVDLLLESGADPNFGGDEPPLPRFDDVEHPPGRSNGTGAEAARGRCGYQRTQTDREEQSLPTGRPNRASPTAPARMVSTAVSATSAGATP